MLSRANCIKSIPLTHSCWPQNVMIIALYPNVQRRLYEIGKSTRSMSSMRSEGGLSACPPRALEDRRACCYWGGWMWTAPDETLSHRRTVHILDKFKATSRALPPYTGAQAPARSPTLFSTGAIVPDGFLGVEISTESIYFFPILAHWHQFECHRRVIQVR